MSQTQLSENDRNKTTVLTTFIYTKCEETEREHDISVARHAAHSACWDTLFKQAVKTGSGFAPDPDAFRLHRSLSIDRLSSLERLEMLERDDQEQEDTVDDRFGSRDKEDAETAPSSQSKQGFKHDVPVQVLTRAMRDGLHFHLQSNTVTDTSKERNFGRDSIEVEKRNQPNFALGGNRTARKHGK